MTATAEAATDGGAPIRLPHHDNYSDDKLRRILGRVRTFAMVGASAQWRRPSYYAMKYLTGKGYRVIPVNPARAGDEILGETVYGSVSEVPHRLDMVDIFRTSEEALAIAEETVACKDEKGIEVLWMQLTVRNDEAAALAEAAGIEVVMNRCPKIEFGRLSGELGWCGVNSRIVSSKSLRPPR